MLAVLSLSCGGDPDGGSRCSNGEQRSCYNGPESTQGIGSCAAGTQVCEDRRWGPCEGESLPAEIEVCNGSDDT